MAEQVATDGWISHFFFGGCAPRPRSAWKEVCEGRARENRRCIQGCTIGYCRYESPSCKVHAIVKFICKDFRFCHVAWLPVILSQRIPGTCWYTLLPAAQCWDHQHRGPPPPGTTGSPAPRQRACGFAPGRSMALSRGTPTERAGLQEFHARSRAFQTYRSLLRRVTTGWQLSLCMAGS